MSGRRVEYVVKQNVRNRVVREGDQTRQRELWRTLAVGCVLVATLLFSLWQRAGLLQQGYLLPEMQEERAEQEAIQQHLKIQLEALRTPERIEQMAIGELDLVMPTQEEVVILNRVVPVQPANSAIVAVR